MKVETTAPRDHTGTYAEARTTLHGAFEEVAVRTRLGAAAAMIETILIKCIEIPAAILVLLEILLLFSAVVARYVFHTPFVWSDELASILFLWLAMLGSVVAFQRQEHMRMTAVVSILTGNTRHFVELLSIAAALAFLVLIVPASLRYAVEETFVRTPAMDIQNSWRAAALPTSFGFMLVFALLKLAQSASLRLAAAAVIAVVAVFAIFWGLKPFLAGLGNINLVIFFVGGVAACVFAGVPIAFSFAIATFGYLILTTRTPPLIIVGRIDEGVSHLILLAIPLFVFLGQLIQMTGMARAMVAFLASLLGHVRGGLHYVLIAAMYLVSGISGSKAADMAAVAPVLFPEMKSRGANEGDLVALLAATGAQTETVPPSIVLIAVGSATGVSIAALFTGGLLPGLILAITLCFLVRWRCRNDRLGDVKKASKSEIRGLFFASLPALALPFVIRSAVIEGVATATEVSTIGIAYSAIAGVLFYRQFDWRRLKPMLVDTASLSGAILLIIGAATAMAWGLTQSGFSTALAQALSSLPGGAATFMVVSIIMFIILGSVLEGIPAIVLFAPLLFPVAQQFGIHQVHYAMVVVLAMGIGLFAPPFGVGYYAACAITRVSPDAGMRPIVGYVIAMAIGLAVVAAVPWLSIGFLHSPAN